MLRQGTPFLRRLRGQAAGRRWARSLGALRRRAARLRGGIFAAAKKGRLWYGLIPVELAARLGSDRERVVRALEYLEEQGLIELRASEPRLRFTRVDTPDGPRRAGRDA